MQIFRKQVAPVIKTVNSLQRPPPAMIPDTATYITHRRRCFGSWETTEPFTLEVSALVKRKGGDVGKEELRTS